MAERGDYTVENVYQGGYSSLSPSYGDVFTGYRASPGTIGQSTDARTANQLKEVATKLSGGQKNVEVSMISHEMVDLIPPQHLKEINRISKLTGTDMTVHGPLVEPSGISQQGGFNETQREVAERQMKLAIEKSHEINPKGNIPVTFHTSNGIPAPDVVKTKDGEEIRSMVVINQDTGQMTLVKREVKHYPGNVMVDKESNIIPLEKGEIHEVGKQLRILNNSSWENPLTQLVAIKERTDGMINETTPIVEGVIRRFQSGEAKSMNDLTSKQREAFSRYQNAAQEIHDIHSQLNSIFSKGYQYGTEEQKDYFKAVSEDFKKNLELGRSGNGVDNLKGQSNAIQGLMEGLRVDELNRHGLAPPQTYKPLNDFAMDKSTDSFANVAFDSFKKFGDKAPIVAIENPPAGMGFSRAEDLKNMIVRSREKFVEKAVKEKGISENEAKQQAEKLIGATWDVGHINQLRQFGFTKEDTIKEAEKIAPYLKHMHLSDNFGVANVEMPMGMGNVAFKEIMEKLGKKGNDVKKSIEAAHWWQYFSEQGRIAPLQATYEAMGSPIYSEGVSPYWNQIPGFQQGYSSGIGPSFPQINYETFGAGFSTLPSELGGQRQGAGGGRMSGKGME